MEGGVCVQTPSGCRRAAQSRLQRRQRGRTATWGTACFRLAAALTAVLLLCAAARAHAPDDQHNATTPVVPPEPVASAVATPEAAGEALPELGPEDAFNSTGAPPTMATPASSPPEAAELHVEPLSAVSPVVVVAVPAETASGSEATSSKGLDAVSEAATVAVEAPGTGTAEAEEVEVSSSAPVVTMTTDNALSVGQTAVSTPSAAVVATVGVTVPVVPASPEPPATMPPLEEFVKIMIDRHLNPPETVQSDDSPPVIKRDEDGVKSRVNHASKDAGATIISTNEGMKGASNLLDDNLDKYALSSCNNKWWVVVQLPEEIQITDFELANYERYSSSLGRFELLGTMQYRENGDWFLLGEYEVHHPKREAFLIAKPIFVKYLKLRMITHKGSEFFCTLTSFKVYGTTVADEIVKDMLQSDHTSRVIRNLPTGTPAVPSLEAPLINAAAAPAAPADISISADAAVTGQPAVVPVPPSVNAASVTMMSTQQQQQQQHHHHPAPPSATQPPVVSQPPAQTGTVMQPNVTASEGADSPKLKKPTNSTQASSQSEGPAAHRPARTPWLETSRATREWWVAAFAQPSVIPLKPSKPVVVGQSLPSNSTSSGHNVTEVPVSDTIGVSAAPTATTVNSPQETSVVSTPDDAADVAAETIADAAEAVAPVQVVPLDSSASDLTALPVSEDTLNASAQVLETPVQCIVLEEAPTTPDVSSTNATSVSAEPEPAGCAEPEQNVTTTEEAQGSSTSGIGVGAGVSGLAAVDGEAIAVEDDSDLVAELGMEPTGATQSDNISKAAAEPPAMVTPLPASGAVPVASPTTIPAPSINAPAAQTAAPPAVAATTIAPAAAAVGSNNQEPLAGLAIGKSGKSVYNILGTRIRGIEADVAALVLYVSQAHDKNGALARELQNFVNKSDFESFRQEVRSLMLHQSATGQASEPLVFNVTVAGNNSDAELSQLRATVQQLSGDVRDLNWLLWVTTGVSVGMFMLMIVTLVCVTCKKS